VEQAFASISREDFLTPPPWTIFAPGGWYDAQTSDPAELYQDVLVTLDRAKGINNGQPSLHAAWMQTVDPQPGETVLHIGIGAGYYTAILARLVGPDGQVHAYEIEPALAELAASHLAPFDNVTVHAGTGVGATFPAADVVYVNAGVTAPDPGWLRCLKDGGRLICPWQPRGRAGITLLARRMGDVFSAAPTTAVGFIPCTGTDEQPERRVEWGDLQRTRSVWLSADRKPDDTATVIYPHIWFSWSPANRAVGPRLG